MTALAVAASIMAHLVAGANTKAATKVERLVLLAAFFGVIWTWVSVAIWLWGLL